MGRRLAYKSMFPEAIAWYEGAIETYPESYRLRRHVGHRMLTMRRIDAAVDALTTARELAAQHPNRLEPDGAPGPSGEPRSTTHGNIDYHLALAHYLRGEFDRAAELWSLCLTRWSRNDDSRVAAMHWLYTSLVRAGRAREAIRVLETPIDPDDVIENFAYHELVELYRGDLALADLMARDERSAALDYGIARHLLARGDTERGDAMLDELLLREGGPPSACSPRRPTWRAGTAWPRRPSEPPGSGPPGSVAHVGSPHLSVHCAQGVGDLGLHGLIGRERAIHAPRPEPVTVPTHAQDEPDLVAVDLHVESAAVALAEPFLDPDREQVAGVVPARRARPGRRGDGELLLDLVVGEQDLHGAPDDRQDPLAP